MILTAFTLGCGGAGSTVPDQTFDRTVVGVWERVEQSDPPAVLTINHDGTYRYQYASVDHTRGYTYSASTLVLQENVITSPDTYAVTFPARDRMTWRIDYIYGFSTMHWRRVAPAPQ